jgi:hypothetical protein
MVNEFAEVWLQSDVCEADFDSVYGGICAELNSPHNDLEDLDPVSYGAIRKQQCGATLSADSDPKLWMSKVSHVAL